MDVNNRDMKGSTPMHWACNLRAEDAIAYLMPFKPDLAIQDEMGFTALHLAIRSVDVSKSIKFVRFLLMKGARRD